MIALETGRDIITFLLIMILEFILWKKLYPIRSQEVLKNSELMDCDAKKVKKIADLTHFSSMNLASLIVKMEKAFNEFFRTEPELSE